MIYEQEIDQMFSLCTIFETFPVKMIMRDATGQFLNLNLRTPPKGWYVVKNPRPVTFPKKTIHKIDMYTVSCIKNMSNYCNFRRYQYSDSNV